MLEQIFLKILGMSLTASFIIVIVFIARALLKRFPKFISYVLWSVVLFRLLCPVSFQSSVSPVPDINSKTLYKYTMEEGPTLLEGFGESIVLDHVDEIKNDLQIDDTNMEPVAEQEEKGTGGSGFNMFLLIGKYVWISGIGIMLLYVVISFASLQQKVLVSELLRDNVYIADEVFTPFVLGIVKPKIYLPVGLEQKEQKYVILHEQTHIRRLDHIFKLLAFGALCIHWFNPLVWVSFILFCRDMEMSCDESVIRRMGEGIRADYARTLLTLSSANKVVHNFSVTFGEGDIKGRIKNIAAHRKMKKSVITTVMTLVLVLIVCLAFNHKSLMTDEENVIDEEKKSAELNQVKQSDIKDEETEEFRVSPDIEEHYITNTGDPSNLYYIDENKVLWGCGRNNYGQLGQGTQDYDFHDEMVRIAETVIHVDYSQEGFTIFLTEDNKLYGIGNAGCGALQQYASFDWDKYINGEHYYVSEPVLLMEDVIYARCGRNDIVCLKEDGTAWTWGTICIDGGYLSSNVYYLQRPKQILENVVLITGGWFNHAALCQDGSVWTWGYNSAENCGISDVAVVKEPTKVADGVVMVWTGSLDYNVECKNITEFDGIYPVYLNNTVIRKADGSTWICGENVGTEEKVISGAEGDYSVICSSEFQPYEK